MPFPRNAVWALTRASLGFATTPISLQLSPDLGYEPLFTTEQSFYDIKDKWLQKTDGGGGAAIAAQGSSSRGGGKAKRKSRPGASSSPAAPLAKADPSDPRSAADWSARPLSTNPLQRVLDRLSGPEPSFWELALTSCGLLLGCFVASNQALPVSPQAIYRCLVMCEIYSYRMHCGCSPGPQRSGAWRWRSV